MNKLTWDPQLYSQFAAMRGRPFFDLVAQVGSKDPAKVIDLGCGPGNLTETLVERWPGAHILGLDSSETMIDTAREQHNDPRLSFELFEAREFEPQDADVIISNAMLQWVPEHRELLATWASKLKEGAWMAIQVPGNFAAPSHALVRELAAEPQWRDQLTGILRGTETVSEPSEYFQILAEAGMLPQVWETTYNQILPGEDAVFNWIRGTALRPVIDVLSGQDFEKFSAELKPRLLQAYPPLAQGTPFLFRRIFMVAQKPMR